MRNGYEIDYIIHEYYRQTGRIAVDSIDSWIEAAKFVRRFRRPRKKIKGTRSSGKRSGG